MSIANIKISFRLKAIEEKATIKDVDRDIDYLKSNIEGEIDPSLSERLDSLRLQGYKSAMKSWLEMAQNLVSYGKVPYENIQGRGVCSQN